MVTTATLAPVSARPEAIDLPPARPRTATRDRWIAEGALLATALAYGLSQLQLLRVNLGWDESIYFSQVSRTVPAAFFSAPRARGITWLAEPLAMFSSSAPALRIYLAVLSAAALYLAFRVWFRVLPAGGVVIAAMLFASLWITRFYGAELMPNLWVAFAAVAAVGGFLRVARAERDLVGMVAAAGGLAFAAVMRPSDAAWVVLPLLVATLLVPAWRTRWRLYLLTLMGFVVGALPWVIEANQRFGGVSARINQASAIQGGLGWHPQVLMQHWQTLDGPLLCRPCSPQPVPPTNSFWLLLILPVAVLAIFVVRRIAGTGGSTGLATSADTGRGSGGGTGRASVVVATVVGLSIAVPYLLLVDYSAPRFLLPAFALLSLPFGVSLWWLITLVLRLARRRSSRYRYPLIGVLALGLLLGLGGQAVSQQLTLNQRVASASNSTQVYSALAADLHRLGVQSPCVLSGYRSPQVAYYTGCASRNVNGHDASITADQLAALGSHEVVGALVRPGYKPPHYAHTWPRHDLPTGDGGKPWAVYLEPRSAS
jgi:hypothetical protein